MSERIDLSKPRHVAWVAAAVVMLGLWVAVLSPQPVRKLNPDGSPIVALAPDGTPKLRAIERECHLSFERIRQSETAAEARALVRSTLARCEAVWLIRDDGGVNVLEHEWQIPVLPR
jgi:hypothetical protein